MTQVSSPGDFDYTNVAPQTSAHSTGYFGYTDVAPQSPAHHGHHAGWILGLIAICCAFAGMATFGILFFPATFIISTVGFILSVRRKSRTAWGIVLCVVGWILWVVCPAVVMYNPGLTALPQPLFY